MKFKSGLNIWHWLSSSKGTVHFTTRVWFYLEEGNAAFFSFSIRNVSNHLLCCIQNNDINTSSLISSSPAYKKFMCFDIVSDKHSVWSLHSSSVGPGLRKHVLCQFLLPWATDTQNWYYVKIPPQKLAESQFYTIIFHQGNSQLCLTKGRSWRCRWRCHWRLSPLSYV